MGVTAVGLRRIPAVLRAQQAKQSVTASATMAACNSSARAGGWRWGAGGLGGITVTYRFGGDGGSGHTSSLDAADVAGGGGGGGVLTGGSATDGGGAGGSGDVGSNGTANTGGGGGGAAEYNNAGGTGGSGLVVIRYPWEAS